jgi:hypothetical protein
LQDWQQVIWSDESKFNVFGSDGRQYCWWQHSKDQLQDHHIIPTIKHGGGSLMVWGCITWYGVGFLCRIENGMDAQLYQNILEDELMATIDWYKLDKESIFFQHDNDPKHTAHSTKKWLKDNNIKTLEWPPQSPDLSPIEHIWNEVDRRVRRCSNQPKNKDELWEVLQDVWEGIEPEFCQKLISSMPKRIEDVRKAKGGYTFW